MACDLSGIRLNFFWFDLFCSAVTEFLGLWSVMSSPFGGLCRQRSLGESQERVGKDVGSRLSTVDSTGQSQCPLFCRLCEGQFSGSCLGSWRKEVRKENLQDDDEGKLLLR